MNGLFNPLRVIDNLLNVDIFFPILLFISVLSFDDLKLQKFLLKKCILLHTFYSNIFKQLAIKYF